MQTLPVVCVTNRSCDVAIKHTNGSHWTDFHGILYWSFFRKSAENIQVFIKTLLKFRILYLQTDIISRSVLHKVRSVSEESCKENLNILYFQ
jgi:hypothetical protein